MEKGERLAALVRGERSLLILDGLEPLQHPPGPDEGQLTDPGVAALLRGLAADNPGLCVVTTRQAVADVAHYRETTAPAIELDNLSEPAGAALLRKLGVKGQEEELRQASREFGGHGLALNLLGTFLRDAAGGDVSRRSEIAERIAEILREVPREVPRIDYFSDSVRLHADQPAEVDQLGRRSFAREIARRFSKIWSEDLDGNADEAFVAHLHAPWGAGKSSFLGFLKKELESGVAVKQGGPNPDLLHWFVVNFNAWQHQHIHPPWWSLLDAVFQQTGVYVRKQKFGLLRVVWLRLTEWTWRFFSGRAHFVIIFAVLLWGAAVFFYRGSSEDSLWSPDKILAASAAGLGSLSTIWGILLSVTRTLVPGSANAASSYEKFARDPMEKLTNHYQKMVARLGNPLAVFIDDVDRCHPDYVVRLLEGIQTLFRSGGVVYLIVGDRRWIQICFEKTYEPFAQEVKESGRPMGHLFLEKAFQLSFSLPRISEAIRDAFWNSLLAGSEEPAALSREEAERKAEELLKDKRTPFEIHKAVDEEHEDIMVDLLVREKALEKLSSKEAERSTLHFLMDFKELLHSNPRAMKRLVNAYALNSAQAVFAQIKLGDTDSKKRKLLALWTILGMRWPLLEEYLVMHPDFVDVIESGDALTEDEPKDIRELLRDVKAVAEVKTVLSGKDLGGPLNSETIAEFSHIRCS